MLGTVDLANQFDYASVNLDFHGVGADSKLENNPLRYNLEPKGGVVTGKYRLGESRYWAGLPTAYFSSSRSTAFTVSLGGREHFIVLSAEAA